MGGCVTEEQAIARAQYLDLVYSQFGTLYELLPGAQRPLTGPTSSKPIDSPPIEGIIVFVAQRSSSTLDTSSKPKYTMTAANSKIVDTPKNPSKALELNVVQSATVEKSLKDNKKGKVKTKQDTPKQDSQNQ